MSRSRILHLIASSRGGGATHVRTLALGLDPDHFRVTVAMPSDGGHVVPGDFTTRGVDFVRVNIAQGFGVSEMHRIRRLAGEADLLHVHGARAGLLGRLAAAGLRSGGMRLRVAYSVHGLALPFYPRWRRFAMTRVERFLNRWTDATIAVSLDERRALLAAGIGQSGQLAVVANGVNPGAFSRSPGARGAVRSNLGIPERAIVIATVCRLHKPRDLDTMVRAFGRLAVRRPDAFMLVVGDGPDRSNVEELRDYLKLGSQVILLGQRRDVPALLSASDIFTLTTWGWEGMPITVLEAMAADLPVVATEAGGIPEVVVEGETGLLVPSMNVNALADAYGRLANDRGLRARMGAAGRERVARVFSAERMVGLTADLYTRLVRRGRTHARTDIAKERTS